MKKHLSRTATLSLLFILFIGCNNNITTVSMPEQLPNMLNYEISPANAKDKSALMFSDQGAWFAYGFPSDKSYYGGFSGPFLITQENGVWSSSALSQLILKVGSKNIEWDENHYISYNSHLEQVLISEALTLTQTLVFESAQRALIKSTITNTSNSSITVEANWQGNPILADGLSFSSQDNTLLISSSNTTATGYITYPTNSIISNTDSTYFTSTESTLLKPNESYNILISQSFIFPQYSLDDSHYDIKKINFDSVLTSRIDQKTLELTKLVAKKRETFNDPKYEEVLSKSILTLQNNWRISAGELKHEGLFPSYHYEWFNGFWSWDSWKHAAGLAKYNPDLAKNQMRAMFDFQADDGFIVDCIYRDTLIEAHNYRDTKPPLAAWAVVKIYEEAKDIDFVKEFYPKLKKYHEWWYLKRDNDQDGLCEYGSTDGSLIAAKWESGMDNAIRFDNSIIVKNMEGAYSLNQESVDLNAYLYAEKLFLSKLAKAINNLEDERTYITEADELKIKIQQQFYDVEDGWFYDTNLEGSSFIKGEGSEGWTPLWANAATQVQAESVKNKMMDPSKFYTKVPFQTMSADHPKFNPLKGYWRGPNWLDQAYFGVKGLRNYGFNNEADQATIKILDGAEGILDKGKSIRENYHPMTGEGLNAENFSWSAAHIIMLLVDE